MLQIPPASLGPPDMTESLETIINKLWIAPEDAEWRPKTNTICLSDLRLWFDSSDIEVLGFAAAMLHDARFRIEPPLTPDEYAHFVMRYYGRCLKEDPKGRWADSRYSAGNALVNVFASLRSDSRAPRQVIAELKSWLGGLYVTGDDQLRTAIVTACLEHLFEQKDIRDFFSDWKQDPILSGPYTQACEWYKRWRADYAWQASVAATEVV